MWKRVSWTGITFAFERRDKEGPPITVSLEHKRALDAYGLSNGEHVLYLFVLTAPNEKEL